MGGDARGQKGGGAHPPPLPRMIWCGMVWYGGVASYGMVVVWYGMVVRLGG